MTRMATSTTTPDSGAQNSPSTLSSAQMSLPEACRASSMTQAEFDALPTEIRDELETLVSVVKQNNPKQLDGLLVPKRFPNKQALLEFLQVKAEEWQEVIGGARRFLKVDEQR